MNDMTAWQNTRLDFQLVSEDDDSVSATLVMIDSEDNAYEFTEQFVNKIADFQSESGITALPEGVYSYIVYENFSEGLPIAYPDPNDCDGECELPTITICAVPAGEDGSS